MRCHFTTSEKTFFAEILKINTLLDSAGNHLSRVNLIIIKFGIEMPDTCGQVTGELKFSNDLLAQTRLSRNQRRVKNQLFRTSFVLLGHHLIPITSKPGTEVVHYHTCINQLIKFCHDFYGPLEGVIYVGNQFLIPSLRDPGFVLFQIILDNEAHQAGIVLSQSHHFQGVSCPPKMTIIN